MEALGESDTGTHERNLDSQFISIGAFQEEWFRFNERHLDYKLLDVRG